MDYTIEQLLKAKQAKECLCGWHGKSSCMSNHKRFCPVWNQAREQLTPQIKEIVVERGITYVEEHLGMKARPNSIVMREDLTQPKVKPPQFGTCKLCGEKVLGNKMLSHRWSCHREVMLESARRGSVVSHAAHSSRPSRGVMVYDGIDAGMKGDGTTLLAVVNEARDNALHLVSLCDETVKALGTLQALESALGDVDNLKLRLQNILAQRDALRERLVRKAMASPGD